MDIPVINIETGKVTVINEQDILYFYSENKHTYVKTESETYQFPQTLSDWNKVFPHFEQLHRSNLVNISQVKTYSPTYKKVRFSGGHCAYVSRNNAYKVKRIPIRRDKR